MVRSVLVAAVVVVVASIPGSSLQSQHHELFVHSMRPCQPTRPGDDDLMPMDLNAPLEDDAVARLRETDIFLAGVQGWVFLCFIFRKCVWWQIDVDGLRKAMKLLFVDFGRRV